ncbi:MAG: ABC transporter permease [Candidatus Parvarchaeota archaeon]|nr:ABC transporter permease [Candidatus Parvarchaeota archaeon]
MKGSELSRFGEIKIALKYQFYSYLRTKKFIALVLLVAAISIAVLALEIHSGTAAITSQYQNPMAYLFSFMQNITFVIILVAAFFGGSAISTDFASNYSYFILVQPVRRSSLLIGRYISAFIASLIIVLVYYIFAAGGSIYFFSSIPLVFASSIGLAAVFIASVLAFAFFMSSLFNNPQTSTMAVVILLVIALPILSNLLPALANIEPWFLINYGGQVVYNIFSNNFMHFSSSTIPTKAGKYTVSQYQPYLLEGIEIMLGYLIVFLVAALYTYNYKQVLN